MEEILMEYNTDRLLKNNSYYMISWCPTSVNKYDFIEWLKEKWYIKTKDSTASLVCVWDMIPSYIYKLINK